MKSFSRSCRLRAWLVAGAWRGPVSARQKAPAPATAAPPLKPASPAAIAAAKEILAMKNASAMYANAVPGIVVQTKQRAAAEQPQLPEGPQRGRRDRRKNLAGREKEIGDGMAKIYASEFTEQELKDLVTFYKSPLGQKLLASEPKAIQGSMAYMNSLGAELRRGDQRPVPRRNAQARQGDLSGEWRVAAM